MEFTNPGLTQQNIFNPTLQLPSGKHKLTKNDITIQFVLAAPAENTYKCRFIISIHPIKFVMAGQQIRASQIDMVSLHDAIIENINPYDRKYMVLKRFDTLICEFYLNFDLWFKDAMANVSPKTFISKFDQEFSLKVQPPKMIMFDSMRSQFSTFVAGRFKDWLVKNNKENSFFMKLIPKSIKDIIKIKTSNMFTYEYDFQWNRLIARMKPQYVLGLAYVLTMAVDELNKDKNVKFNVKVEKNAKNYSKDDWKSYIRKRFI